MRIVFLNGPARSGKDSSGRALVRAIDGAQVVKMATALKSGTHALFGIRDVTSEAFEAVKDEPRAEFFGKTPRQAYIYVSEECIKPAFGPEFFGRVLAQSIRRLRDCRLAVVTDSGFAGEAMPVVREFGADNALLIRLHRPGYGFAGDSRSHIELPDVRTLDVHNDGPEANLHRDVVEAVSQWAFAPA